MLARLDGDNDTVDPATVFFVPFFVSIVASHISPALFLVGPSEQGKKRTETGLHTLSGTPRLFALVCIPPLVLLQDHQGI